MAYPDNVGLWRVECVQVDGLMTIFFLVVGAEIRQEIHDGALASFKMAILPLGAPLGGYRPSFTW